MSLTRDMKAELAALPVTQPDHQRAEVATLLRLAGGITLAAAGMMIEAEIDSEPGMKRTVCLLRSLYGVDPEVVVVQGGSLHKGSRYVVRVVGGAERLAVRAGLLSQSRRPIHGLPPWIVGGSRDEVLAAWRGAFIARGSLSAPTRSSALDVTCPGPEVALALVGAARRLGVGAKTRSVRGLHRVVVREGDQIAKLIEVLGATRTLQDWTSQRSRRLARGSVNRLANFDDANLRRSARAAVNAAARVERAFAILGDDVPEHLRLAGELRVRFKEASLEELGKQADPPLTKDAVAGRIRRLLALADKTARERGIPDTTRGIGE